MVTRFMTTATGRAPGDHVCWPFHGMDDLVAAARGYVREGLDRREQVTFCRVTPDGMQCGVVSDVAEVGRPADADLPVLAPMTTEPGWTPSTSPLEPIGRMTDAALADGYSGLRLFTDATEMARELDSRRRWVRWEHLMDRYALVRPLAVLCGYDVESLGVEVVGETACVHGLTGELPSPFLLRAADPDGRLALVGEVDRNSAVALYRAVLEIAGASSAPIVLDLSEQDFIDHTGLVALHRAARALDTTVELVGASPLTALLVDAFALTGITVREAS